MMEVDTPTRPNLGNSFDWMEAKVGFSKLKIMVGPAQNATQNCMPNWAATLSNEANAKFCAEANRKMQLKEENP